MNTNNKAQGGGNPLPVLKVQIVDGIVERQWAVVRGPGLDRLPEGTHDLYAHTTSPSAPVGVSLEALRREAQDLLDSATKRLDTAETQATAAFDWWLGRRDTLVELLEKITQQPAPVAPVGVEGWRGCLNVCRWKFARRMVMTLRGRLALMRACYKAVRTCTAPSPSSPQNGRRLDMAAMRRLGSTSSTRTATSASRSRGATGLWWWS